MGRPVAEKPRSLCPSAQPDWRGSRLIGVVGGTADDPRVSLLAPPRPVTDALLQLADPVHPTEVFRFAAPCLCSGCVHFEGARCRLVERVVDLLPEVAIDLPECDIRPHCRWWQQEGRPACLRCAQIVTENLNPSDPMREAALPVVQR
jgi:hypothetical protein